MAKCMNINTMLLLKIQHMIDIDQQDDLIIEDDDDADDEMRRGKNKRIPSELINSTAILHFVLQPYFSSSSLL